MYDQTWKEAPINPGFWALKKANVISANETYVRALYNHYPSLSAIDQKIIVYFKYEGILKNKAKQVYIWSISYLYYIFKYFKY